MKTKIQCDAGWKLCAIYMALYKVFPCSETEGILLLTKKLACPFTAFCPQNVDFAIFMQFLTILSKMSPTSPP